MARPRKEIDREEFEKLCALQCSKKEICGWFDVTDKTVDSWVRRTYWKNYSDVYEEKRGRGKIALRRAQFRLAEKSPAMAIWLGKQYLGQRDTPAETEAVGKLADLIDGLKEPVSYGAEDENESD